MGFLVEHGRVVFFYCTLKEQRLEPPLKIWRVLSVLVWGGKDAVKRRGMKPRSIFALHENARALVLRGEEHGG